MAKQYIKGLDGKLYRDANTGLPLVVDVPEGSDGKPNIATTSTEIEALMTVENVGKIIKYEGEDGTYINGEYYVVTDNVDSKQYYILPELTDAATPEDIILGKKAIDANGEIVVGTLEMPDNESKLALILGTQDATNNPYEITASDLGDMTEIGAYAFYEKDGMTNIDLSNITKIGLKAFYGCDGLTEVTIDNDIPPVSEAGWFTNCKNLKKITAPKLTIIPQRFLEGCNNIEELDCPELVEIKGSYSMGGISSKRSFVGKDLVFPKVTYVGQSAFYYCGARKMSFPSIVNGLESFTFYTNPNLEEIDLPLLETAPTTYFIYNCNKMVSVYLPKLKALNFGCIDYNANLKLIDLPVASSLTCATYQFRSMSNVKLKLGYDGVVTLNKASNLSYPTAITEVYVHPDWVEDYKIATNWVDWIAQGTVTIKSLDEFVEEQEVAE